MKINKKCFFLTLLSIWIRKFSISSKSTTFFIKLIVIFKKTTFNSRKNLASASICSVTTDGCTEIQIKKLPFKFGSFSKNIYFNTCNKNEWHSIFVMLVYIITRKYCYIINLILQMSRKKHYS
jgi:hypothetical protein